MRFAGGGAGVGYAKALGVVATVGADGSGALGISIVGRGEW
jgi:hypothetical protein